MPEPMKAKLDALRGKGYTASGFIRAVLERELNVRTTFWAERTVNDGTLNDRGSISEVNVWWITYSGRHRHISGSSPQDRRIRETRKTA